MIMHTIGTLMAIIGLLLQEIGIVGMWMSLVGIILWGIAEGQLLSAVQK